MQTLNGWDDQLLSCRDFQRHLNSKLEKYQLQRSVGNSCVTLRPSPPFQLAQFVSTIDEADPPSSRPPASARRVGYSNWVLASIASVTKVFWACVLAIRKPMTSMKATANTLTDEEPPHSDSDTNFITLFFATHRRCSLRQQQML